MSDVRPGRAGHGRRRLHEADTERPGAFAAVVATAGDHPLLAAHAAPRRPALRLSELVESAPLTRSELYDHPFHPARVQYEIAIGMRRGRGEAIVLGLGRT